MKFGDELTGKIDRVDQKGRGVFTYHLPHDANETRDVVIPFTAPGDEVTARFIKRDQGTWIGALEHIEHPAETRVPTPCPHAGVCGGCLWQHMHYEAQLDLKRLHINSALERARHDERITTVIPSPNTLHYRNRMDYVIGWQGTIGLKEYGSWNRYLDLRTCLLLDEATPLILQKVRDWMKKHVLAPWDARTYMGLLRYCVIRLGRNTNERMVTLIVKDLLGVCETARQDLMHELSSFATTLCLGENPEITDLSLAKTLILLHGKDSLTEEVNGLRYLIHPNSFFQTNTIMAATLQDKVLEYLGLQSIGYRVSGIGYPNQTPYSIPDTLRQPADSILDLYCGSGFFGIACAKQGAMVYGHELDSDAIVLARKNALLNHVENRATFGAGPVEQLDWPALAPDAVILDPPRSGLHPHALRVLLEKKPPVIVYVSCNYQRLFEELKELKRVYRIEKMEALDLFPQTPHVEVIVKLMI